jgi:hypothetical protein
VALLGVITGFGTRQKESRCSRRRLRDASFASSKAT